MLRGADQAAAAASEAACACDSKRATSALAAATAAGGASAAPQKTLKFLGRVEYAATPKQVDEACGLLERAVQAQRGRWRVLKHGDLWHGREKE